MSQRLSFTVFLLLFGACRGNLRSPAVMSPVVFGVATAVPVYEEPRHRLVFQNRYARVLDVVIPPGDTTQGQRADLPTSPPRHHATPANRPH